LDSAQTPSHHQASQSDCPGWAEESCARGILPLIKTRWLPPWPSRWRHGIESCTMAFVMSLCTQVHVLLQLRSAVEKPLHGFHDHLGTHSSVKLGDADRLSDLCCTHCARPDKLYTAWFSNSCSSSTTGTHSACSVCCCQTQYATQPAAPSKSHSPNVLCCARIICMQCMQGVVVAG
jgi:hypothetical protein